MSAKNEKAAPGVVGQMAHEHAEWFGSVVVWVYEQAFEHGFKHGAGIPHEWKGADE